MAGISKNLMAIIGVVVVVAVAAVVAVTFMGNGGDNGGNNGGNSSSDFPAAPVTGEGRVAIYGNANMDDTIDDKDIAYLEYLIKYPQNTKAVTEFADANCDGKIDNDDVELVKKIINKEKCEIFYKNYFDEKQKIPFPVDTSSIAVTYWQQGEAVSILGLWDNVTVASQAITKNKANQYNLDGVTAVGTTGSSSAAVNEAGLSAMVENDVTLVIATPSTAIKDALNTLPGATSIYLWYAGDYCIPTILTLGVLLDAQDKAKAYVDYAEGITSNIATKLAAQYGKDLPSVLVTMLYSNEDTRYASNGGHAVLAGANEGAYTLIQCLGNVFGETAENMDAWGKSYKNEEWLLSPKNQFDFIIDLEENTGFRIPDTPGEKFFSQADYNARFEANVHYFEGTTAYDNGQIIGSTYVLGGFSGYSMLPMIAFMMYPEIFTLEDAQKSLQTWFDEFTVTEIDVKTQGGYYYNGKNFATPYNNEYIKFAAMCCKTLDNADLKVLGNVNGDATIDNKDVEILTGLINYINELGDKTGVVDRFKIADANNNGTIDAADIALIESIINWKSGDDQVTVWHVNYHDTIIGSDSSTGDGVMDLELESTKYPITATLMTGSANSFMLTYMLGIIDEVKGASYGSTNDKTLYSENYLNTSKVTKLGTSSQSITFEGGRAGSTDVIANENVTAVLTDWNRGYITNYGAFETAGIDVVRVAAASTDKEVYTHSILLLGFLFQKQERAGQLLELYDEAAQMIETYKGDGSLTGVASSTTANISAGNSDYTAILYAAGLGFGLENYPSAGAATVKPADHLDVYDTDKYNFDYIVHLRTAVDYSGVIKESDLKSYTDAFPLWKYSNGEHQYVVSGMIPVPLRILYVESIFNDNLDKAAVDVLHNKFIQGFFAEGKKTIDATSVSFIVDGTTLYGTLDTIAADAVADISSATLKVFGNVNGDDKIDKTDLAILDALIRTGKTAAEFPSADANQDGVLDNLDKAVVAKYAANLECTVYAINTVGQKISVAYPVAATGAGKIAETFIMAYEDKSTSTGEIMGIKSSTEDKAEITQSYSSTRGNAVNMITVSVESDINAAYNEAKDKILALDGTSPMGTTSYAPLEVDGMTIDYACESVTFSSGSCYLGFVMKTGNTLIVSEKFYIAGAGSADYIDDLLLALQAAATAA